MTYLRRLREIFRYLGICDGNMEEGSFRCDANISLRPGGADPDWGPRAELKNMNSFKHVEKALEFEIRRQQGGPGRRRQAGPGNPALGRGPGHRPSPCGARRRPTITAIFPIRIWCPWPSSPEWIEEVRQDLPELPEARRRRFLGQYGLPENDAEVLTSSKALADYFEACVGLASPAQDGRQLDHGGTDRELNRDGREIEACPGAAGAVGRSAGPDPRGGDQRQDRQNRFRGDVPTGADPSGHR